MNSMKKYLNKILPLVARLSMSAVFILAGIGKIQDSSGTVQYMAAYGIPAPDVLMVIALIVEIVGGLSLLLGFKAKWGAGILALYLLVVTLTLHTAFSDQMQVTQFLKNTAILGGLLMVIQYGSGPFSITKQRS